MDTNHIFETAGRLRCCQLKWTVSVVNWWRSRVTSFSRWPSTSVYNTVGMSLRRADLSSAAETCLSRRIKAKYGVTITLWVNFCMPNWPGWAKGNGYRSLRNSKFGHICGRGFFSALSRLEGARVYIDQAEILYERAHHSFTIARQIWPRSVRSMYQSRRNSKFGHICSFSLQGRHDALITAKFGMEEHTVSCAKIQPHRRRMSTGAPVFKIIWDMWLFWRFCSDSAMRRISVNM